MINTQTSSQITRIYLVTNCYGDPNKVYIGKTKNSRKQSHKYKFGKLITYDYIDEVNSLDYNDWEPLETFWIQYFKFLGFNIQNKREKGGSGTNSHTLETRQNMSLIHMGKIFSPESKLKKSKPILQYDIQGNFVREWPSATIASLKLGLDKANITSCCNKGKTKSVSKFIFRHKLNPLTDKEILDLNKSIIQYDLNGKFIQKWDNILKISQYLGFSYYSILKCCNKKANTGYNFIWRYENDLLCNNDINFSKKGCNVLQFNKNGELIKCWDTIRLASKTLKIHESGISSCCSGRYKTYGKFIWKKLDDIYLYINN